MKYLIVGRSATGKTALMQMLTQQGLKPLYTCTTRSIRDQNDTGHIFMTEDEANRIPDEDKLCHTVYDQHQYFTTRQAVAEADVLILEPSGVWDILNAFPEEAFHVIYMSATDPALRKQFAIARAGTDATTATIAFAQRVNNESQLFDQFEKSLKAMTDDGKPLAPNANLLIRIENDFQEATLKNWAAWLAGQLKAFRNMTAIIEQCVELGVLDANDEGRLKLVRLDDSEAFVAKDYFVDMVLQDEEGLSKVIRSWLTHDLNIGVPSELLATEGEDPAVPADPDGSNTEQMDQTSLFN